MNKQLFTVKPKQSIPPDHYYRYLLKELSASGKTIDDLISSKKLYLRISIVGNCNFKCKFCHNEGGPTEGSLSLSDSRFIISMAKDIGYNRVQFTGGEPLLNKQLERHLELCRHYIDDVGITTNGSLLVRRISSLIEAGLTRIHLSLQRETLIANHPTRWTIPDWLATVLQKCSDAGVVVRLNIPVEPSELSAAREFISEVGHLNCDLLLFSLLPNDSLQHRQQYIDELKSICSAEKERREKQTTSQIYAREYFKPSGIRCGSCEAKNVCAESSRSLRVGVDMTLRPCLATRYWDIPITRLDTRDSLLKATLFALDYSPFNH